MLLIEPAYMGQPLDDVQAFHSVAWSFVTNCLGSARGEEPNHWPEIAFQLLPGKPGVAPVLMELSPWMDANFIVFKLLQKGLKVLLLQPGRL